MDNRRLQNLLIAYSSNEILPKDYNELMDYIASSGQDDELYAFMEKVWDGRPVEKSFTDLQSDLLYKRIIGDRRFNQLATLESAPFITSQAEQQPQGKLVRILTEEKNNTAKLWQAITAAAVILIIMSVGLYFYIDQPKSRGIDSVDLAKYDVKPGGNHAVLTLADGSKIELTSIDTGKIAEQAGMSIQKTADGQLIYEVSGKAKSNTKGEVGYNTIATPNGGQYQVNLPDGTRVWINAGSSLTFPTAFVNNNKRIVELSGEGYFEVAKEKTPFIVRTNDQAVEVLGTHFNISNYANDAVTKTTLLEGSVKVLLSNSTSNVTEGIILKPGQQALLKAGQLNVRAVDTDAEVAWKSGYFIFKNEDMRSIMRKIERWYDVEVLFAKDFQNRSFEGSISRFKNVSEVLRKFELTGNIHFNIEERRITVMP